MKNRFILLTFMCVFIINVFAQNNNKQHQEKQLPLYDQIKKSIKQETFNLNVLVQSGGSLSLQDDDFLGGKTFKLYNARIILRGKLDGGFFYGLQVNFVKEPNLVDAFVGYKQSKYFRVSLGAMKPKQTQDFIAPPNKTDFIGHTKINALLVQSCELGLAMEGDVSGLYYFLGLFNGNKLSLAKKDSYYGVGRLQYNMKEVLGGKLQLGVQSSYGYTPYDSVKPLRSGSSGPIIRGKRFIYGADIRLKTKKLLLAAEYMGGNIETQRFISSDEVIDGYYITAGYSVLEKTMVLARWQNWNQKKKKINNNMLTIGVNQKITNITKAQLNFDVFVPDGNAKNKYGVSFLMQIVF